MKCWLTLTMLFVSCFKCAIELDSQINYMEAILNESIFSLGQKMVLPSLISCLNIFPLELLKYQLSFLG